MKTQPGTHPIDLAFLKSFFHFCCLIKFDDLTFFHNLNYLSLIQKRILCTVQSENVSLFKKKIMLQSKKNLLYPNIFNMLKSENQKFLHIYEKEKLKCSIDVR